MYRPPNRARRSPGWLGEATAAWAQPARLGDNGEKQHNQADCEQNQVKHVGAHHRTVAAEGGIDDKQIYHDHRHGVGDVKQGGGHHAESLVLGHQVKNVHQNKDDAVDDLQGAGAVMDTEQLRNGDDVVLIQSPGHKPQQKRPQKPGNHRKDQGRQAVFIHTAGQAEDGDGGNPGSRKGTHAQGQVHLPLTDKIVLRRVRVPQAALSDNQQDNRVDAKVT